MKNVKRLPIPNSLRENAKAWTDDLLTAIDNHKKKGEEIPISLKNQYKQDDVLETLKQMYSDGYGTYFCCYCETPIEPVSYPQIEHRKPKDINLFPEDTFNWDNLHLVCQTCNTSKRTKWDYEHEILDAVVDVPIEEHLGYKVEFPEGIFRETLSNRGITTKEHADLNRKSLRLARLKLYGPIQEKIQEIISLGGDPKSNTAKEILIEKCKGQHGSLVKWLLKKWKVIE